MIIIQAKFITGTIQEAVKEAISLAIRTRAGVEFLFNGISITVFPDSNLDKAIERYWEEVKAISGALIPEFRKEYYTGTGL